MPGAERLRQDFEQMMNMLREGVYLVDLDRKITFWNKAAERISGYRSDEVLGSSCKDNILIHVDSTGRNLCNDGCPLHATMADREIRMADVFLHHRRGYRVPVSCGRPHSRMRTEMWSEESRSLPRSAPRKISASGWKSWRGGPSLTP